MSNNKFSQFSQLYVLQCSIEQVRLARHVSAIARQMCWFFGVFFGERIDTCVLVGICVHLCVDLSGFCSSASSVERAGEGEILRKKNKVGYGQAWTPILSI